MRDNFFVANITSYFKPLRGLSADHGHGDGPVEDLREEFAANAEELTDRLQTWRQSPTYQTQFVIQRGKNLPCR